MSTERRALIVILDGLGDRPIRDLGGKTPLEVAQKETLNSLAREGVTGLMDPLAPGVRVGTDVGHLALFGYNPMRIYWGRGPIEAAGVGLELSPGDVAFRANFATVNEEGYIVDRRAGRIREGTDELAAAIDGMELTGGIKVTFRPGTEHRAVLVLHGERLSPLVSDSDPGPLHIWVKPKPIKPRVAGSSAAGRTAAAVEEFTKRSHRILSDHPLNRHRISKGLPPANYILLRGAGIKRPMRSLTERFNIRGACVVAESTIVGIARMTGFEVIKRNSFTANLDTDVEGKVAAALEALNSHPLVIIHYKGTDIASHDGLVEEKVKFIERVDAALATAYEAAKKEGFYIAVTSDHSTPCSLKEHSADPVPILFFGPDVLPDGVEVFTERACMAGGLHRITANAFLLIVLDYLGVTYRFGA